MSKNEKEKPFVSRIGGQALLEGVMMQSPTSQAMAVRDFRGELVVYSKRTAGKRKWYSRVPILRGFMSFIMSLVTSMKTLTKSLEPLGEEDEQLSKGETFFSIFLGIVLAVGLFAVVPKLINWLIIDLWLNLSQTFATQNYIYVLITSAISGVIRVAILVLYMGVISKMKSIYRMYQYHGAEHRTINCYEHKLPLTVENVQKCSTRHNRCGTTFLFYTVMVSILISILVAFLLAVFGLDINSVKLFFGNDTVGTLMYNLLLIGANLLVFPLTSGISYEFLKLMARTPDNWFFMIFKAPGLALQKLSTKIPDDEHAQAAILAFETVMKLDENPNFATQDFYEMTLPAARKYVQERYEKAGITEESEIDWLLCDLLDTDKAGLRAVTALTNKQGMSLVSMVEKRTSGLPLEYVTGKTEFYGQKMNVTNAVLVPRMDTETVVRCAVDIIGDKEMKVLDLMTGSGCIALALSACTNAHITASDISDEAIVVAQSNLSGIQVIKSDVFERITEKYDLIISNPPYIKSDVVPTLEKEVTAQPLRALDGGADGLKFYRIIAQKSPEYLTDGGYLVLEIGYDQAAEVTALLANNFTDIKVISDIGGNDRTVVAKKK